MSAVVRIAPAPESADKPRPSDLTSSTPSYTLFCGTESADVLSLSISGSDFGTTTATPARVATTSNPLNLKDNHGGGGLGVEWILIHPNEKWLYAFISFWDLAPCELVTFENVDQQSVSGGLREVSMLLLRTPSATRLLVITSPLCECLHEQVSRTSTEGYQGAHAVFLPATIAVACYHSGTVALFAVGTDGGPATLICNVACPGPKGVPRSVPKAPFKDPGFSASHAHGFEFDADHTMLLVADAGMGTVVAYKLSPHPGSTGALTIDAPPVSSPVARPRHIFGPPSQEALAESVGHRPRHLAFASARCDVLLVVQECSNAISAHRYDRSAGTLAPAHAVVGANAFGPSGLCCGVARAFASCTPLVPGVLPVVCFGIAAAAEIAVHAKSGCVVVSNRNFVIGRGESGPAPQQRPGSLRVYAPIRGVDGLLTDLTPVQDVQVGANPRHVVFVRSRDKGAAAAGADAGRSGSEVLLVGVTGGVEVFDVSDEGVLSFRSRTSFASFEKDVNCVAVAGLKL